MNGPSQIIFIFLLVPLIIILLFLRTFFLALILVILRHYNIHMQTILNLHVELRIYSPAYCLLTRLASFALTFRRFVY